MLMHLLLRGLFLYRHGNKPPCGRRHIRPANKLRHYPCRGACRFSTAKNRITRNKIAVKYHPPQTRTTPAPRAHAAAATNGRSRVCRRIRRLGPPDWIARPHRGCAPLAPSGQFTPFTVWRGGMDSLYLSAHVSRYVSGLYCWTLCQTYRKTC